MNKTITRCLFFGLATIFIASCQSKDTTAKPKEDILLVLAKNGTINIKDVPKIPQNKKMDANARKDRRKLKNAEFELTVPLKDMEYVSLVQKKDLTINTFKTGKALLKNMPPRNVQFPKDKFATLIIGKKYITTKMLGSKTTASSQHFYFKPYGHGRKMVNYISRKTRNYPTEKHSSGQILLLINEDPAP